MKIEHEVLVSYLHIARRERLKALYDQLGFVFHSSAYAPDVARLLHEIRNIEATDVFQKAREVAALIEKEEP